MPSPSKSLFLRTVPVLLSSIVVIFFVVIALSLISSAGTAVAADYFSADDPVGPIKSVRAAPALQVVAFTATKRDALLVDNDSDGDADPGDALRYTVVITNTGSDPATDVTFIDTIDMNTTLSGTAHVSPIAFDDSYDSLGNVGISVAVGSGLLSNDVDPDNNSGTLTIASADTSSANGGEVSVAADGSFSYTPAPGFEGTDSFTYTVSDGDPLTPDGPGTVTITVAEVIWFVDNTAAGGGDGRLATPYNSLSAYSGAADDPGDIIFLYSGSGSYSDGITLQDNQYLIGQGATASIAAATGITVPLHSNALPGTGGASPTITNSSGDGVTLAASNTLRGFDVGVAGGFGVAGSSVGALAVSEVSINNTSGGGVNINGSGAMNVVFDSLAASGGTNGISLANVAGTFTANGGSVSGSSGTAVAINGGNATITYAGSVSKTSAGSLVSVTAVTGGSVTLSGDLTCNSSCTGVSVTSNNGGTITFSGGSKVLNTGGNTAVNLNNNSGATINFTNGGLDIDTTSGAGFSATDGGTVNITGGNNIINTGTGTGVNIVNTIIGTSSVTFTSVAVNGAANGIVLNNTGSGGFTITGNGGVCTIVTPTCTGGRIQSTTGADEAVAGSGVYLMNTGSVSLSFMRIDNHPNYAIFGNTVTGFSLIDSIVDGTNGNNDALDEGSIRFDELLGSAAITRSDISGGWEDNLRLVNSTGTLDRLVITDSSFHDNSSTLGNDGILLESRNSAEINISVTGTSFSAHRGDHFDANATDNSILDVVFTGNTMTGGHPNALGQTFILSNGASADVTFQVENNTINGAILSAFTFFQSAATTASSSLNGTFTGNTIGTSGDNGSGSEQGNGVVVNATGNGTVTILADDNEIRQWSNPHGFLVQAGDGSPVINVTILNSTIIEPNTASFPANGLHLNAGTTAAGAASVCLDVRNTDMVGSGASGADDFRLRQRNSSTVNLPGYGGTSSDTAAVVSFVQGNNTGTPSGSASVSGLGGGFTGNGSSCPTPAIVTTVGKVSDFPQAALAKSIPVESLSPIQSPAHRFLPHYVPTSDQLPINDRRISSIKYQNLTVSELPSSTLNSGSALFSGETINVPIGTLPAGKTVTVVFDATIDNTIAADDAEVCNQAVIQSNELPDVLTDDPDTGAVGDATCTAVPQADLSLSKTDSPDPVLAGDALVYTVTVSNDGPSAAQNVVVTDTLPAGLTFVATSGCLEDPNGLPTCTLGTIPASSSAQVVISTTVDSGTSGTITNSAGVTSSTHDPVSGNNTAEADTAVHPPASITIIKDADPADGTDFAFTSDLGSFTLDDAVPDDTDAFSDIEIFGSLFPGTYTFSETAPLPGDFALTGLSCDTGSWSADLGNRAVTVTLAAGEDVTCTFTNTINQPPALANVAITSPINENDTATLTGDISDPDSGDSFTLTVDWGDGSAPEIFAYAAGTTSFSETHPYLDDNPTGTPSDSNAVGLTLEDSAGNSTTGNTSITVNNVPPTLTGVTVNNTNGMVILNGSINDVGSQDTFTLTVDWGDGSLPETFNYAAATTSFSETHPYPDADAATTYAIDLTLEDDDTGVTSDQVTATVGESTIFLPVVFNNYASLPDLIVDDLVVTSSDVQVLVRNVGDTAVVEDFWVDVYIDPSPPPTGVNQTWQMSADEGLVWGVSGVVLQPGDTLLLTIGGSYYFANQSNFSGVIPNDTPVYAQVDSASAGVNYGSVLETHESAGGVYNNIVGPIMPTTTLLHLLPSIGPLALPQPGMLPERP